MLVAMQIRRVYALTDRELIDSFRLDDVLQVLPAPAGTPKPTEVGGDWALSVEFAFDPRICPERPTDQDRWAHDLRERTRFNELAAKVDRARHTGWSDGEARRREMLRPVAISQEILRLLALFNGYKFEDRQPRKTWVLDESAGPRMVVYWGMGGWNPIQASSLEGSFTERAEPDDADLRRHRLSDIDLGDARQLDPSLAVHFQAFFALEDSQKMAFARASGLWVQARDIEARDIWGTSKSLSLFAAVAAIEHLIQVSDPGLKECGACNQPVSEAKCDKCGQSTFGLTRRFRDFVGRHLSDADTQEERSPVRKLAGELYSARSNLAHGHSLLRADEFDSGFNAGGNDDQSHFERVTTVARRVLLSWLRERANLPPLSEIDL
jgi:hypothetical protein